MSKNPKDEPKITPVSGSLQESLASAVAKAGDERKNVSVSLKIAGGLPSQAYQLDFQVSGEGAVRCEMGCEMSGRKAKSEAGTLKDAEFGTLLKKVVESGVLNVPQEQPRFLPDTLVGVLEISDGVSVYRTYFAADPDQAKQQNQTLRPELEKTINELYRMAAKVAGTRSVKP